MARWSKLLTDIRAFIEDNPEHEGCKQIIQSAEGSGKDLGEYLANLDIRDAGKLRELVRDAFPKNLRGNEMLMADTNDKGQWVINLKTEDWRLKLATHFKQ